METDRETQSKKIEGTMEKSAAKETTSRSNADEDSASTQGGHGKHVKEMENKSSQQSSPNSKDLTTTTEEDEIKSTKAEIGEVREENERLKNLLSKMVQDYQSLQMKFYDIVQQEEVKKSAEKAPSLTIEHKEDAEMVSLSLGINSNDEAKKEEIKISNVRAKVGIKDEGKSSGCLGLGLDCKFEPESAESWKNNMSSESTFEEHKEEEPTEVWPPSKVLKPIRSGDEEVLQQNPLKKPRVCVRARCDATTLNDGCQWRKYGQKLAKGNPCPRAYYRCTVSSNCPVRKQVQRCAEDMSILITTYEGNHNHPLPVSATAMASTTSAAASMLQSRSSSSSEPGLCSSVTAPVPLCIGSNSSIRGLNFTFGQNSSTPQFYFPNSSVSTSNSHPTITLDLTAPANSNRFNRFSSTFPSSQGFSSSSTCLNFSSSSDHSGGYFSYGLPSQSHNRSQVGFLNLARQLPNHQEHTFQPFALINNHNPASSSQQQSLTETLAAATKVITANPSFQSALAAALTSFVGNNGGRESQSGVESSNKNLKIGQSLPGDINGFSPSCYNKSTPLNSQQASLNCFPPSLPLYTSKSGSGSAVDKRDNS